MLVVLYALVSFVTAAAGDVVEAYSVQATVARDPWRMARMSIAMYLISFAGWVIVIKVSLWYCIAEVLGLAVGSLIAGYRQRAAARNA